MKKILLIYLPFCTPASPPYSITYLYSFLKANSSHNIEVLDLNIEFHKLKFPEFHQYYKNKKNWKDYDKITADYNKLASETYSKNNKGVVTGNRPELLDEMLKKIKSKKPDIIAFSIVYSSQAFYAYSLMKELKDVECIIGGPAVNDKLRQVAHMTLNNEIELLNHITDNKIHKPLLTKVLDFSIYKLDDYFTPYPVIPIKTSSTCFYRKCAFCTHFNNSFYYEFPIGDIKKTIINSNQKYFFLIDDMIHTKRLLELADTFKPLNIHWTCQLRPTKDLDYKTLKKLRESGLTMVMWGVESGNDRILNLINKGTNNQDIAQVLQDSHDAGIKNIVYIIFGFPTETKEEFVDTINFLTENKDTIDLVSTSIFGLQKGTIIYNNPEKFGITSISETERTVLEPRITYKTKTGLSQEQATKLRQGYKRTIEKINKYPKTMNFFREHMFCII